MDSFKNGFELGYTGPTIRKNKSRNIPITVGSSLEMWNKIMKEVQLKRYAGPFTEDQLPFDNFVQSPIGLVPKAGNKTRLIFHLSYDFNDFKSVNHYIPEKICTVKYRDLDHAITNSLQILEDLKSTGVIYYSKSDLT